MDYKTGVALTQLYNSLIPGYKMPDDYTKADSMKKGFKLKQIVMPIESTYLSPIRVNPELLKYFVSSQYTNIIPVDDYRGHLYGFVLVFKNPKSFYFYKFFNFMILGLDNFQEYKRNDLIIVCEGFKDVMAVRRVYPYCVGFLTAFNSNIAEFLNYLSSKILFIKDNDLAGARSKYKAMKFYKWNVENSWGEKDMGEYWELDDSDGAKDLYEIYIDNLLMVYK